MDYSNSKINDDDSSYKYGNSIYLKDMLEFDKYGNVDYYNYES